MAEVPFRWYADAERDFVRLWQKPETNFVLVYLGVLTLGEYIELVRGMTTFHKLYLTTLEMMNMTDMNQEAIIAVMTSVYHLARNLYDVSFGFQ